MTSCLETVYPYVKLRKNFGRQPQFLEDHGRIHTNIKPNKVHRKKVLRKLLVDREIQAVPGIVRSPVCSNHQNAPTHMLRVTFHLSCSKAII